MLPMDLLLGGAGGLCECYMRCGRQDVRVSAVCNERKPKHDETTPPLDKKIYPIWSDGNDMHSFVNNANGPKCNNSYKHSMD